MFCNDFVKYMCTLFVVYDIANVVLHEWFSRNRSTTVAETTRTFCSSKWKCTRGGREENEDKPRDQLDPKWHCIKDGCKDDSRLYYTASPYRLLFRICDLSKILRSCHNYLTANFPNTLDVYAMFC